MRRKVDFCADWRFIREDVGIEQADEAATEPVTLPHTWNAQDGTDGGNDYHRGRCWYAKRFPMPAHSSEEEVLLEFEGAAMSAQVFLNGNLLYTHDGGYATFRVNLTDHLQAENVLAVLVDNSKNDRVYPQKADFTFYGGLYRPVWLLTVPKVSFDLSDSSSGLFVTAEMQGPDALVTLEAHTQHADDGETVVFSVEGIGEVRGTVQGNQARAQMLISNAHLWEGKRDPYLYRATATLSSGDQVSASFGCRSFAFDPQQGFLLNGRRYPLCGAARHQDRQGVGSAITEAMMEEDMNIMLEMGANTIRLAHYQHAQAFYDLCDQKGMIVWVEIPYITEHMANGRENTLSQMRELVTQCRNHPSIVCWGLSNEITASGGVNDDLMENHRLLNDLCHRLDPTRPTTMAHAFMLDHHHPLVRLTDIRSYNLYYGWYLGDLEDNDAWFDAYHAEHPNEVIGLSEYGADANPAYQSPNPERGDWTESYQAVYHEHMLKMWQERPYIWAMYCWNMFDFGADGRNEGGKPGQNQKGLVTFDRKIRKDAFYIYKAYLSDEPFVHLCGRRYVNRAESETEIKVYTNQPKVTLLVDGQSIGEQEVDKIARFHIPLTGEHEIQATAGSCTDSIRVCKVDAPDPAYRMEGSEVVNWFDQPEELMREGYYSIMDTMADLKRNPAAAKLLTAIMAKARSSYGDVAKNVQLPEAAQRKMDQMPLQKLLKQTGKAITPDVVKELNHALNQIPKEV